MIDDRDSRPTCRPAEFARPRSTPPATGVRMCESLEGDTTDVSEGKGKLLSVKDRIPDATWSW